MLVAKIPRKGAESARSQLPSLLDAAQSGRSTLITRRGRAIAAVVPASVLETARQRSILELAGSGKGYWGRDSSATLRRMRGEWSR